MTVSFRNKTPQIAEDCFLAEGSVVIGDTHIGAGSSVWFQTVIRGDVHSIRIGEKTNIQDLTMVHVTSQNSPEPAATSIGSRVTIGHRVIVHGCTIADQCLIGMGAILLDGAHIGENSIIGAGSLVTKGTQIPPNSLALGSPAKVVRELTDMEIKFNELSAEHYYQLAQEYLAQR